MKRFRQNSKYCIEFDNGHDNYACNKSINAYTIWWVTIPQEAEFKKRLGEAKRLGKATLKE